MLKFVCMADELPQPPASEEEPQPEFKHVAAGYAVVFGGMIALGLFIALLMKLLR